MQGPSRVSEGRLEEVLSQNSPQDLWRRRCPPIFLGSSQACWLGWPCPGCLLITSTCMTTGSGTWYRSLSGTRLITTLAQASKCTVYALPTSALPRPNRSSGFCRLWKTPTPRGRLWLFTACWASEEREPCWPVTLQRPTTSVGWTPSRKSASCGRAPSRHTIRRKQWFSFTSVQSSRRKG